MTKEEPMQRCPVFVWSTKCKPWAATRLVGGRKYCDFCAESMMRLVAESVQQEVMA